MVNTAQGLVLYMCVCVYVHTAYTYIRDSPHVAVGGSMTATRRQVVGENISVSRVRHSGYGRKAAAHPQLLREQPLFLWGFPCLSKGLSSYVGAKTRLLLLRSASWRMHDSDREIWGCIEHIVIKHLKEKMVIIKNICKILLCITCETHSDAVTCWNYQRLCHQ